MAAARKSITHKLPLATTTENVLPCCVRVSKRFSCNFLIFLFSIFNFFFYCGQTVLAVWQLNCCAGKYTSFACRLSTTSAAHTTRFSNFVIVRNSCASVCGNQVLSLTALFSRRCASCVDVCLASFIS